MLDGIQRLIDRAAIQDLMSRYARGVDRRDWNTVAQTFHPDAHDDHGEYKGGVEGFLKWVSERHAKIPQSMHFLGNCLIEFTGPDVALVETYFIARQTISADATAAKSMIEGRGESSGAAEAQIWGRYIDIAERRNGEWRTARRIVAFDAMQAGPATSLPLKESWAQSQRDPSDPLNVMRKRAEGMAQK